MPLDQQFVDNKIAGPIRKVLATLISTASGSPSSASAARAELVASADLALLSEYPQTRALDPALRQQWIEKVMDTTVPAGATTLGPMATAASSPAIEVPERAAVALGSSAPGKSVQGFMLDGETADAAAMESAVAGVLGAGWKVDRIEGTSASFHATDPAAVLSVREAWELAHRLADHPSVATAEPVIEWVPAPAGIGGANALGLAPGSLSFGVRPSLLACANHCEWSVDEIQTKAAWDASEAEGRPTQGEGIKVAHIDTGITHHTELPLNSPGILLNAGANFYDPNRTDNLPLDPMDAGAIDVLRTWFIPMNGHGTGTLSVLLSALGPQTGSSTSGGSQFVTGTAPKVIVVPIRVSPTVVHWNLARMIKAIRHAHLSGCHVITMSMGGPPPDGKALEEVVNAAVDDGVIFCSAAGNVIGNQDWFPIVVWPAALDNVIAVGGSNCRQEAWDGSSRGPEVNISAPAQEVWHAVGKDGALRPSDPPGTETFAGNGTSFATPAVAGLAACWLAHHGRESLVQRYGHTRYIPRAFAYLLRTAAFTTPPNWKTNLLGPGLLDGAKLLAATLPPKAALAEWPRKEHTLSSRLLAGIFRTMYVITPNDAAVASAKSLPVASVLGSEDEQAMLLARRFGGELRYLLFDRPALFAPIVQDLSTASVKAAVSQQNISVQQSPSVSAALKAFASPRLAAALP
jgi:serine protease